jgi:MFS family permease
MAAISSPVPKRTIKFLLGISIFMLGANFVWIAYNSVLLPTLVENVNMEYRGPIVGALGFFGSVLGITISLLAGVVSDHTHSRWGKRTPGILVGTLLGLPFIALAAVFYPPGMLVIVVSFFGMQVFTNVANGAWFPLLVDVVPENQRGLASGLGGFLTLVGVALGIVLVTLLNQNGLTDLALWLLAIVFAASGVVNALVIRGYDKSADRLATRLHLWQLFKAMFHVRTFVAAFFWVAISAFLANMGVNSLQFFARFFFESYFPAISPDYGFRVMGGINLLFTMLSAFGSGVLSDRIGRHKLILLGMFVSAAATLLMGLVSDFNLFMIVAAVRSVATGPIVAVMPALASDLSPVDEAGQYMAYNNLSTGLSGALASLVFGAVLTSVSRTGFLMLFILSAGLFLAGGLLYLAKVPQDVPANQLKASQ